MKSVELINENNSKKKKFNFALAEHILRQGEVMRKRIGVTDFKYWVLPEKSSYIFEGGSIIKKKD
jgi:hypothetical protein